MAAVAIVLEMDFSYETFLYASSKMNIDNFRIIRVEFLKYMPFCSEAAFFDVSHEGITVHGFLLSNFRRGLL